MITACTPTTARTPEDVAVRMAEDGARAEMVDASVSDAKVAEAAVAEAAVAEAAVAEAAVADEVVAAPQDAEPQDAEPQDAEPQDAAATAEIVAALTKLPQLVAPRRHPHDVFAAVVDREGHWSVDIVDWQLPEAAPVGDLLVTVDGAVTLPDGHSLLPRGWSNDDEWILVTRAGTVPKRATTHAVSLSGGSGQLFVHVGLGPAPKGATGPAVALRGKVGKSSPRMVTPEGMRPAAIAPDLLASLHAAMVRGFDAETRGAMRRTKLREKDVLVYPGRFPNGAGHVAFVVHETTGEDGMTLSAMSFVRDDGTVEFFRQADVLGEMTLVGLVDLEGDGFDEIVLEDRYHEGQYTELVHWRSGRPKLRVLTGDGL